MTKRLTILILTLIFSLTFSTIANARINIETDENSNLRYISNKKLSDTSGIIFSKTMKYKKDPVYMIEFVGPAKKWLTAISDRKAKGILALGIDTIEEFEDLVIPIYSITPIIEKTWYITLQAEVTQEQIEKIRNAKEVFYSVGATGFMPLTPRNGIGLIKDDDLDEWKRIIEME